MSIMELQWSEFLIMRNFDAPSWKIFIICTRSHFTASTLCMFNFAVYNYHFIGAYGIMYIPSLFLNY